MKAPLLLPILAAVSALASDATFTAATSINTLGIELLGRAGGPDANTLLSPYSIQSALAMTFAGAEGVTRDEMAKVLYLPPDPGDVNRAFGELRRALESIVEESAARTVREKQRRATNTPIFLTVANRLFGQTGYTFRESFLATVKNSYGAPFEALDFSKAPSAAAKQINSWVEEVTRNRIRDLLPEGALNELTRLVLVNAIYLKAPWDESFPETATKPRPFYLPKHAVGDRPTMNRRGQLGYLKREGFTIVAISYRGGELQFLILLPDKEDGIAKLERELTAETLATGTNLPPQEINLYLPKFRLIPPLIQLGSTLRALGMKSAFNDPRGSANFDGIAPRRQDDYLYLSEVFHKTFLELDEKGTEAAAATAVTMVVASMARPRTEPIEVRVDHPFLFAIQHRASGACLFLGRVTDPN